MTASTPRIDTTKPSLSFREAYELLGMGRTLAYELHRAGQFPVSTYRNGRHIRVATQPLLEYMAGRKAA